jgi:hypothetical protein
MEHRHLNTAHWSAAAVDSALERGNLKDWRELFTEVQASDEVAELVLRIAREHPQGGASVLATALALRLRPGAYALKFPERGGPGDQH